MQTYRLTVGPDGQVRIPDGKPGEVVTVVVDAAPATPPEREMLTLATAKTPEERAEVIDELKRLSREIRDSAKSDPSFTDHDLYDDDGLPA